MPEHGSIPEFIQKGIEIELPLPGVRGWMIGDGRQQAVFVEFGQTIDVPEHSHAEQWEIPIAGRVDVKRRGGVETYQPGNSFFIPAGQLHGATVHAGYKAIMVFNEPDRYKPKQSV